MTSQAESEILLYTRQPFVAAGLRAVLSSDRRFRLSGCFDCMAAVLTALRDCRPQTLLVHLSPLTTLAELAQIRSAHPQTRTVLWGDEAGADFAFQALQLGVRGIVPSHTSIDNMLATLMSVEAGVLCYDKGLIDSVMFHERVALTRREGEVLALVAQGLRNKAIGASLGITEGTVKVYLYKLFKKLGVNDRLEMALYSLKNLGGALWQCRTPEPDPRGRRAHGYYTPPSLPARRLERKPHRLNRCA